MDTNDTPDAQSEKREDTTPIQRKPGGVTGKGFSKGDPRINRRGRPKTFDQLREMVKAVGHEQITGTELSRIMAKIRKMYASDHPRDSELLLQYGWGKVKEEAELDVKLNWIEKAKANNIDPDEIDRRARIALESDSGSDTRPNDSGEGTDVA